LLTWMILISTRHGQREQGSSSYLDTTQKHQSFLI